MRRVLVTGASGFIGGHLVRSLLLRGIEVVVLTRTGSVGPAHGPRPFQADVTNPDSLRGAADGCDIVFHLAGLSHRMGSGPAPAEQEYDRVNVGGSRAIAAEARRAGVRRLVFMSSTSAAARETRIALSESLPPAPVDSYGRSKLRAEAEIRAAGAQGDLCTIIVRPPMVYGPGNRGNLPRLMRLVRAGVPLPFGAVKNARSVLYIENLLHALNLLMEQPVPSGEVFYVADAQSFSTPELIAFIGDAVARRPRLVPVPVGVLRALGRIGDVVAGRANLPFTTQEVLRLTGSLVVDQSKLRQACGYVAPYSTQQGIHALARSIYDVAPQSS